MSGKRLFAFTPVLQRKMPVPHKGERYYFQFWKITKFRTTSISEEAREL